MREEFRSAPIHIYRDSAGDFSIQCNEDNEKGIVLYRKYLTDEDYKALNDLNEPIKYLSVQELEKPETTRSKTILDCSSLYNQNAPSSFHIYYIASTDTVHGNLCIPRAAYSRSFGKSLQNIKFNVQASNLRRDNKCVPENGADRGGRIGLGLRSSSLKTLSTDCPTLGWKPYF